MSCAQIHFVLIREWKELVPTAKKPDRKLSEYCDRTISVQIVRYEHINFSSDFPVRLRPA